MRRADSKGYLMNSFTQLVQNVKDANWQGAGQVFKEIMQQKVADRLDI